MRSRLSHERFSTYQAIIAGLATLSARAQQIQAQADAGIVDAPATAEMRSISKAVSDATLELVALCCHHWDSVRDPDNPDRELVFPDDLGDLDQTDFEALWNGVQAGIGSGRPDPKASRPPFGSTSRPKADRGRKTPRPISSARSNSTTGAALSA